METRLAQIERQTDSLKKDWSYLEALKLDNCAQINRSAVFQQNIQVDGTELPVYIKLYAYSKPPWQRWFRQSKSRNEVRNLLFFKSIHIPTPRIIAWGVRKNRLGLIREEFIITEAIPKTKMLDDYVTAACPDRSTCEFRKRRDSIIDQLSQWTRKMHESGFFHQDLKWRNILARTKGTQVELFWIDCPKGYFSSFSIQQKHGRIKDCATLDKIARIRCTHKERRQFVAGYLKQAINSTEVETFSSKISRYRRNRFDAQDEQQRAKANATRKK
jgi:tRNA A-37 threonylcarbamoyl transferase component Bud32